MQPGPRGALRYIWTTPRFCLVRYLGEPLMCRPCLEPSPTYSTGSCRCAPHAIYQYAQTFPPTGVSSSLSKLSFALVVPSTLSVLFFKKGNGQPGERSGEGPQNHRTQAFFSSGSPHLSLTNLEARPSIPPFSSNENPLHRVRN